MKSINSKVLGIAFLGTSFLFGCQKESVRTAPSNVSTQENKSAATSGVTQTLSLRPGPDDGQDAYVEWKADNPSTANANFNYVAELPPTAWTDGGANVIQRIYINFTGLSAVPKTATVISATLHLYGLDHSLNSPQGNSSYPGSPYNIYGPNKCVIGQITSAWDETTITWNTQPGYIVNDHVVFGPSTTQWNWDAAINVTDIVKRMVRYPSKNFGFGVKLGKEQVYRGIVFGSSEAAENDRPMLVVEYAL